MRVPDGPATLADVRQAGQDAWWSLNGRPGPGGGFPLSEQDIQSYSEAAIEELAETMRFFREVEISGGTVANQSQYSVPNGVLGVLCAIVGGVRMLPHLRLAQIDAVTHDPSSSSGVPRFCHYDRELNRLILVPAPVLGGERLTLIAAVSFEGGADIPHALLGYVTMRAIASARSSRLAAMPEVAQVADSLADSWRRLPT